MVETRGKKIPIPVKLSREVVERMDQLVLDKGYSSRSDFIQTSIEKYLNFDEFRKMLREETKDLLLTDEDVIKELQQALSKAFVEIFRE